MAILGRQGHRDAERHTGRDDRDLVDGVVLRKDRGAQGVAGLVVRRALEFFAAAHHRASLDAEQSPVASRVEVDRIDLVASTTHGEERGFVDQVGQISAGHTRGAACDHVDIDVVAGVFALQVHPEDLHAILEFGEWHDDLAVETPSPEQGGVEDVGPVGGCHHHEALGAFEAVHLGEHLVEGLLSLVVSAAEASAALRPMESISSMKMIAFPILRADSNRSRRGWRRRPRTSP